MREHLFSLLLAILAAVVLYELAAITADSWDATLTRRISRSDSATYTAVSLVIAGALGLVAHLLVEHQRRQVGL